MNQDWEKSSQDESIFGKTIECECGKIHTIEPRTVIYSDDAIDRLEAVLSEHAKGRRAVVLMDERTAGVAGREAARVLTRSSWQVSEVIVPDRDADRRPVCDDRTHDRLIRDIQVADIVLSTGSGVLTDLGKWIAYDLNIPHICFATAASMNGYTSANVAPTMKGVKVLVRARPPRAVLSAPAVLRDAPYEMTASGFGDILAKSASSADWRMNHVLFGDYYCERSVSLIAEIEPLYMDHPEDVRDRRCEAIAALFSALLLTGAAMTMAETSAPSSGGEHLISHTLDMMSYIDGNEHDLHGRQVGVGTILVSEIYRRLLSIESPIFATPHDGTDRRFWGVLGDEVEKQYSQKLERSRKAAEVLAKNDAWDRLREEVRPLLRQPQQIRDCLKRAGAAFRAEDIGCSRERLLLALLHAHEMRSRFTVIDLARLSGVLPGAAAEIVEEWS